MRTRWAYGNARRFGLEMRAGKGGVADKCKPRYFLSCVKPGHGRAFQTDARASGGLTRLTPMLLDVLPEGADPALFFSDQ